MASRSSLYKWKKQETTSSFASRGNVQEWVKQVQKASDDAARDIFGDQPSTLFGRQNVLVDDAAISEAQDLLDSWIQKRQVGDLLTECDLGEEKWSHIGHSQHDAVNGLESYRLSSDGTIHCDPQDFSYQHDINTVKPAFELNDDFDEEYAVQEVVHNMLGKDLVNVDSFNTDILQIKTKKFKDPTPKMELRHKQVKEKAKERKVAWTNAHQKKLTRKLVEQEAHKQLDREEKEQQFKTKREEEEIRREMVKIRKAMQDDNKIRTKLRTREKEEDESANMLAKQEVGEQQIENENQIRRDNAAKATMKRLLLKQMEEDKSKQKQDNLKLLHQCFSSWYAIVVNKRIKIGKARALFDWKHKLRTWNAWRTYVWRLRGDRETRALTHEMKERHRKEALADRFYHQLICQRWLTAWLSYVWKEKQEKKFKEQHDERANKMASLLKAAASGKLCQKPEEKPNNKDIDTVPDSNCDEVEEIFLQPLKREAACTFLNKENKEFRNSKGTVKGAKHAWPHEILRDMKTKQTRHGTIMKVASCNVEKELDSQHSRDSDNTSIMKNVRSDNSLNMNKTTISETTAVLGQSKATDISEAKLNYRNVATSKASSGITPNELKVGNETPSTARSTIYLASKQSKPTSRKASTKPLHLAMEERAKCRAERKSKLETNRREAEEQQLAKLKKEQEVKEKEIEAEKQTMFQKKREEKKIAKQHELEKQHRMEELKTLNRRADGHYCASLVKYYGVRPWKTLVTNIRDKTCSAVRFNENQLQKGCFHEWSRYTKNQCELRHELAMNFYKRMLLRRGLLSWKKHRHHLIKMHHIAVNFSKRCIVRRYLNTWQDYVTEERLLYWDKENRADEHNERRIMKIALMYWKKYIPLLKEEEKREKRKADLRKHVQSLLPDFRALKLNHSP